MADKVPKIRKGLTREDLLRDTWIQDRCNPNVLTEAERAGHKTFMAVLDAFLAYVEKSDRVTRKDVTSFFITIEHFTAIREHINEKITKGEFTPGILDKLVENI